MKLNRKHIALFAVIALIALAGCAGVEEDGASQSADDIAKDTGNNISDVHVGGSYQYEIKMTEKNQIGLVKGQPPFIMDHSLERANLIRRYQYLNDKTNQHHVYLMSNDGKVVAYFVAQGKVSSVNSRLTNGQQIVASEQCFGDDSENDWEYDRQCYKVVESPQMDGSYGTNGDAIFFFTTEGKYVEWNGKYVVSEEPLNIQTAISLEQQVDESGDDASGNETDS